MRGMTHSLVPGEAGKVWLSGSQAVWGRQSCCLRRGILWLTFPIHSLGLRIFIILYDLHTYKFSLWFSKHFTLFLLPEMSNLFLFYLENSSFFCCRNSPNTTFGRKPSCHCGRAALVPCCDTWICIYKSMNPRQMRKYMIVSDAAADWKQTEARHGVSPQEVKSEFLGWAQVEMI